MALIFADSRCAICGDKLSRPYLATSGCAFPREHRLFRLCDAPLHFSCLERWDDRAEFARGYYDADLALWRDGYGTIVHVAEQWFIGAGPSARPALPAFVQIRLRDWPIRLRADFDSWDAYVSHGYTSRLTGAALDYTAAVMRDVRQSLPDQAALIRAWQGTSAE